MEKLTKLASMIFDAKKDFAWREKQVLLTLKKIEVNENVPEGYTSFDLYGDCEYFQITENPDGVVSITN